MKLDFKSLSQRNKNLRYGGYSAVVTLIVAAVLIVGVTLCETVNVNLDLTANQRYTVSESTQKVVADLEDDVVIYGCFQTGFSDQAYYANYIQMVERLIANYELVTSHVTYETVNTLKHPEIVRPFMTEDEATSNIDDGTFIIVNKTNNKFRTLEIGDFYDFSKVDGTIVTPDLFEAEEALTSAIQYVTSKVSPTLYEILGHGEAVLDSRFKSYMLTTNYEFKTMDLKKYGEEDEIEANETTVLCINAPTQDLDDFEYSLLLDYMERGGRMLIFLSPACDSNRLANFNKLMARYGIYYDMNENTSYVLDSDQQHYYKTPYIVLNQLSTSSEITTNIGKSAYSVLMSYPVHMYLGESSGIHTEQETFMQTYSSAAYLADAATEEIVYGPFATGVRASEEKSVGNDIVESKMVVFANSYFISYSTDPFSGYGITTGNFQVVASALGYLQDGVDDLYISSKSLTYATFTPAASDFLVVGFLFVILIPAALIVTGLIIWRKRKNL